MTSTFNPESYGKLLAEYQPKTITTEEENSQAIALAQDLEHRPNRTAEEEMLLELLVTLIEKFEETHYPIPEGTPQEMLMHLMEARDITSETLADALGSWEVTLEIINGDSPSPIGDAARSLLPRSGTETLRERRITKTEAKALAEYFHVDASLFT